MPTLRIRGLRTVNQRQENATLFHPFGDALSLTLDLSASPDLLALRQASFSAEFQIFDPHLHKVVVTSYYGDTFNWGPYFWISKGINSGPPTGYQTPYKWGLNWTANSIFGFRGIVRAQYIPAPGDGWTSVEGLSIIWCNWGCLF